MVGDTMSHIGNDQAKEQWYEDALEYGLSEQDAFDYTEWNMENEGYGSVADYVYFYLKDHKIKYWSV
jgi:hypothetical protein